MTDEYLEVEGGHAISGRIRPSGNKNAALPLLAATLLTEETVTLENVPDIQDVAVMLEILAQLGAEVHRDGATVTVRAQNIGHQPDPALCERIRASVLLAGPLLARKGRVALPPPGGDVIGRRRLDTHVLALEALGGTVSTRTTARPQPSRVTAQRLSFEAPGGLQGGEVFLDEASVTATENAIMAAAMARGRTVLMNAASEPHVQDLCRLLVAMGAEIQGIGTNQLVIAGQAELGGARFRLGPDYIEVGSFITLAAVTGGALVLEDARPEEHRATALAFRKLGIEFHASDDGRDIIVPAEQRLRVDPDFGNAIPKIEDAPWPGFPADLTSLVVVAATQSEGTVLIHEKLFESRLFFVDRLIAMGAQAVLCDPHRVVISGRSPLVAQEMVSPDIRAGMALLIAALCADGTSRIHNIRQIDRGYERIDERLSLLGAKLARRRE